jgi:hypothetical protein
MKFVKIVNITELKCATHALRRANHVCVISIHRALYARAVCISQNSDGDRIGERTQNETSLRKVKNIIGDEYSESKVKAVPDL